MQKTILAERKFGIIAVGKGFATRDAVDQALRIQRQEDEEGQDHRFIGDILVAIGALSEDQKNAILAIDRHRKGGEEKSTRKPEAPLQTRESSSEGKTSDAKVALEDRKFGLIAVNKGFVARCDVERALGVQKTEAQNGKFRRLGRILVETGQLTEAQLLEILASQKSASKKRRRIKGSQAESASKVAPGAGDPSFEISFSKDFSAAFLTLSKNSETPVTLERIKAALASKNVCQGISDDQRIIDFIAQDPAVRSSIQIATGTPPQEGSNGQITYHFDEARARQIGRASATGVGLLVSLDQAGMIPAGSLLAEKTEALPARPGIDVMGREIPAPESFAPDLQAGEGTCLSEDGLRLIAEVDGYPQLAEDGEISVLACLHIESDAGIDTGNILFDGHIEIDGVVRDGIRVAGRSLRAQQINKSKINVSGDVSVQNGINNTVVTAGGQVVAKHISRTTLEALGDITVQNEVTESTLFTNGRCLLPQGKVRASKITAKKGIVAQDVGTEVSNPCVLTVGVDFWAQKETEKRKVQLETGEKKLSELKERLTQLTEESSQLENRMNELAEKEGPLLQKQVELRQALEKAQTGGGDAEAISKIKQEIEQMNADVAGIDQSVSEMIEAQETINKTIDRHRGETQRLEDEIASLEDDILSLAQKVPDNGSPPAIQVNGTIFSQTEVCGINSRRVMAETEHRISISEHKMKDAKSSITWFMRLSRDPA